MAPIGPPLCSIFNADRPDVQERPATSIEKMFEE